MTSSPTCQFNSACGTRRSALGLIARVGVLALGAAVPTPRALALGGCEAEPEPARLEIRHAAQLGTIDKGWWKARYTASWVPESDPGYLAMGPLQLFSQDVIGPGGFFAMHPHENVEVITIALEGSFEHADDAGHTGAASAGDVMLMSAGKGIFHSERGHADMPTRVMTIWLTPRTKDGNPFHAIVTPDSSAPGWCRVAGERGGLLTIDSDARIEMARIEENGSIDYLVEPGRRAYVAADGAVVVNGRMLAAPERAIAGQGVLRFRAAAPASVVVIDVSAV